MRCASYLFWILCLCPLIKLSAAPAIDALFEPEVSPPKVLACVPDYEKSCPGKFPSFSRWEKRNFNAGIVTQPILGGDDFVKSLALGGGDVNYPMLYGYADGGASMHLAAARYLADGFLSTAFHTDGIFTLDVTNKDDLVHAIDAIPFTDRFYFAGRAEGSPVQWMVGEVSGSVLDTSFNTVGYRLGNFLGGNGEIWRALVGRGNFSTFLTGGYVWNATHFDFALASYTVNGDIDTSFNTQGYIVSGLSAFDNGALAIRVLTSPIISVGPVMNGAANWDFGFAYNLTSGPLSTAFHTDGMVTYPVLSGNDKPYAVTHQDNIANGPRYAGGFAHNGAENDFAIVRVTTDGRLDTLFNNTGKLTHDFNGGDDVIFSMICQTDGKLIAVGSSDNSGNIDIAIARYLTSGQLDTTFFTNGKQTYDVAERGGMDIGTTIKIPTGGSYYYVGGRATVTQYTDFALLKVETDGTLAKSSTPSQSFGNSGNGVSVVDINGNDVGNALIYDCVNNWYTSTHTKSGHGLFSFGNTATNAVVVKYTSSTGVLDTSFDTDGKALVTAGGITSLTAGMYSDYGYYFAGDNGTDMITGRFNSVNSSALNTAFHTAGFATIDFNGNDKAYGLFATWGVNITNYVVVGRDGSTPSRFAIAKILLATGSFDTAFNTTGKTTFSPTGNAAVAVSAWSLENTHYVAGYDTQDMIVMRVNHDSSLSTSFNSPLGIKTVDFGGTETLGRMTYDNVFTRIFLAGGDGADFCVAKLLTNGNLDTTFDTDGKLKIDFGGAENAKDLAIRQTLGFGTRAPHFGNKILVVGDDGTQFLVAKLNSNGSLDTSFNTDGKHGYPLTGASTAKSVAVTDDGVICITGSTNGNADIATLCINP